MADNTSHQIYFGGNIKAVGNGMVEGYLVPFTSPEQKDLDGEYFDKSTNLFLEDHPLDSLRVMYQHGLDDTLGVRTVGKVTNQRVDDVGVWVQAQLDLRDEYEQAVYQMAKDGRLGWSSGALPQSVTVDSKTGHIKTWAIIEGSLTPTPAMPVKTITTAKSIAKAIVEDIAQDDSTKQQPTTIQSKEAIKMDMERARDLLNELVSLMADDEAMMMADEDVKEVAETVEKMASDMKPEALTEERMMQMFSDTIKAHEAKKADRKAQLRKAWEASQPAKSQASQFTPNNQHPQAPTPSPRIEVGLSRRYAGKTMEQLAFVAKVAPSMGIELDADFSAAFYDRLKSATEYTGNASEHRANFNVTVKSHLKANEGNVTTIANQGGNWVPTIWDSSLWLKAREMPVIQTLSNAGMWIREIDGRTTKFPTEGSDPTVIGIGEPTDANAVGNPENVFGNGTPITTPTADVTPGTMGAYNWVSFELQEDGIIDALMVAQQQHERAQLDHVNLLIINGDSDGSASTNINLIDGTPAANAYYLKNDGLRKLPLVTNTAQSSDGAGALTLSMYRDALGLLPSAVRKDDVVFIVDASTELATYGLTQVEDNAFQFVTIVNGVITGLYGRPYVGTGFLPLANATGKVSATPANNTTGSIMAIRASYWGLAYRRQITIETERDITAQATKVVSTVRVGTVPRSNDAAAIVYNVGV